MDVTGRITASAGGGELGDIGILMLKKAQGMQESQAAQLIQQLPQTGRAASPAGVGGRLDVVG